MQLTWIFVPCKAAVLNISIILGQFIEVEQHEIWIYSMALKFIGALQEPNMEMHHLFLPTGQVTNAAIIPAPGNMFLPDSRPAIPLPRFSRHLNNSEQAEGAGMGGMCLRLGANCQVLCMFRKNVSFASDLSEKSERSQFFYKLLLIYRYYGGNVEAFSRLPSYVIRFSCFLNKSHGSFSLNADMCGSF